MIVRTWNEGRIGHVELDRPETRNALDGPLVDALRAALAAVAAIDEVRCVVVGGAGASFCVGGDIDVVRAQATDETLALNAMVLAAAEDLEALRIPTIAALHGHALGGGLELALACTMRVAEAGARLGLPEARIGLIPGGGGVARLPEIVGRGPATRMLLTGEAVGADEALRIGLVDAIAPAGRLRDTVTALAARVGESSPLAVRAIREILRAGDAAALAGRQAESDSGLAAILASADRREGLAAFAERRPPHFEGR